MIVRNENGAPSCHWSIESSSSFPHRLPVACPSPGRPLLFITKKTDLIVAYRSSGGIWSASTEKPDAESSLCALLRT